MKAKIPQVRVVVFDMDGTITRPYIDFAAIREAIGAGDRPILEYLDGLAEPERSRAREIVDRFEADAAGKSELNDGVEELLGYLARHGISTAVVTRNSAESAQTVFAKHGIRFDLVVTPQEAPPKPSPEPVRLVARHFAVQPHEMLVVGDFIFDVEAGKAAGTHTAFLTNGMAPVSTGQADYVIERLSDLVSLLSEEGP